MSWILALVVLLLALSFVYFPSTVGQGTQTTTSAKAVNRVAKQVIQNAPAKTATAVAKASATVPKASAALSKTVNTASKAVTTASKTAPKVAKAATTAVAKTVPKTKIAPAAVAKAVVNTAAKVGPKITAKAPTPLPAIVRSDPPVVKRDVEIVQIRVPSYRPGTTVPKPKYLPVVAKEHNAYQAKTSKTSFVVQSRSGGTYADVLKRQ